tara:strand:- start:276 stop:896 length:621 start_codon:yes stop_codon:yes gene_type:complete
MKIEELSISVNGTDFVLTQFEKYDYADLLEMAEMPHFVSTGMNVESDGFVSVQKRVRHYLNAMLDSYLSGPYRCLGLALRNTNGKLIGAVEFSEIGMIDVNDAYMAYFLHPNYRGQGLAMKMVLTAIMFVYQQMGVRVLRTAVDTDNTVQQILLRTLGFEQIDDASVKGICCTTVAEVPNVKQKLLFKIEEKSLLSTLVHRAGLNF